MTQHAPASFYHAGFVVPDIPEAMREFTEATQVKWRGIESRTLGEWDFQIAISTHFPYVELISGPPGSPWDPSDGPRFDHLGWWSHSVETTARRWSDSGLSISFDACPLGGRFAYFNVPSIGARIEAVDIGNQAKFLSTWSPEQTPMRGIDC